MKLLAEGADQSLDVLLAGVLAHQADAPDLAREGTEARADRLRATLTRHSIDAAPPGELTPEAVEQALRDKLTRAEREAVVIPFADSPEIAAWAERVAGDADSDLERGRHLFDELVRRIQTGDLHDTSPTRTAREAFAGWTPNGH